jgi:hypothetical protein
LGSGGGAGGSGLSSGLNPGGTTSCAEAIFPAESNSTATQQLINIRFIVGLRLIDWYVVMPPALGPSNTVYCDIGRAPMMPLT